MAGTKIKPCKSCIWNDFETWLKAKDDVCYKCFQSSKWVPEYSMKIYKITPGYQLNPCYEKDVNAISVWFEEAEPGDRITVDIIEMTEEVYNNLPDYIGP